MTNNHEVPVQAVSDPREGIKARAKAIKATGALVEASGEGLAPIGGYMQRDAEAIECLVDLLPERKSTTTRFEEAARPRVVINGVDLGLAERAEVHSEVEYDDQYYWGPRRYDLVETRHTLSLDLPGFTPERVRSTPDEFDGLNKLRDLAYENAKSKGFHESTPEVTAEGWLANDAMKMALIHSEVSEVLEALRGGDAPNDLYYLEHDARAVSRDRDAYGNLNKPEGVPAELADVIIRVLDYCGSRDIDIAEAVRRKVAYNATRPALHGKEF